MTEKHRIVIIGAGSAGLCSAIQLKRMGIHDFVILEKGIGVGGTWFWNQYPGAECDVQSHLYSFSFEPKLDWSRPFAGQAEILEYLNYLTDKYDVRRHIRFETKVDAMHWRDEDGRYDVELAGDETIDAQIVISAIGMFNNIVWPEIPGVEKFEGTYWHSARWNQDHDLSGERVGVIGIAASAIQFVPEIAPKVDHLSLFQRTANWVVPKNNVPYSEEQLQAFRDDPSLVQKNRDDIYKVWNVLATFSDKEVLAEIEQSGMERLAEVKDKETREKLTPQHPFGCRRPLFSDVYYPVFNRNNVSLVTDDIERIDPKGIVTTDGQLHEVDTIIYSTGFYTTRYLQAFELTGRNGLTIENAWTDGAQAYLGMNTAGFPNLFMLYGPNTNQGSILFMLERQVEYVMRQIKRMDDEQLAWVDIRADAQQRFNENLQDACAKVEVWQAACGGEFYYRHPSGRFVTNWPHSMDEFTAQTRRENAEDFESRALVG
ncbi:MAG: NAD(P)/FAD-dependent oxidoreductase [Pseudomonadota bacterium]